VALPREDAGSTSSTGVRRDGPRERVGAVVPRAPDAVVARSPDRATAPPAVVARSPDRAPGPARGPPSGSRGRWGGFRPGRRGDNGGDGTDRHGDREHLAAETLDPLPGELIPDLELLATGATDGDGHRRHLLHGPVDVLLLRRLRLST